jgi:tripartite-type tricarboxylate transporter receptor subunit TctC
MLRHFFLLASFLVCGLGVGAAAAQDYPTRDIHLINGYAAGAGADVASRVFAKQIEQILGKPVVVENRPGAFTNLAAEDVARAQPDGYTLLFSGHVTITSNIRLFKTLPFDPAKDFTPVAPGGKQPFGFAVPSNSPAKTLSELTAYLKQKGDKATFGYANTLALMITEYYKHLTGAPALAVPYKGAGDALTGLVRGDIDLLVYDLGTLTELERDGKLRVLAVSTAHRSSRRPDLPDMQESGLPDFDLGGWFGIWGPANLPRTVIDRLAMAIRPIWHDEEKRNALSALAVEPFVASPDDFAQFVRSETAKWIRVIALAKIEPQ